MLSELFISERAAPERILLDNRLTDLLDIVQASLLFLFTYHISIFGGSTGVGEGCDGIATDGEPGGISSSHRRWLI